MAKNPAIGNLFHAHSNNLLLLNHSLRTVTVIGLIQLINNYPNLQRNFRVQHPLGRDHIGVCGDYAET